MIVNPIGPQFYKTYQILAPVRTHRRKATCAEVDCVKRARGFRAQFDAGTVAGNRNARWVEASGLRFIREVAGYLVTYTFPAGQDCFDKHTTALEREPLYFLRGGDQRGNPRNTRKVQFRGARDFVDDFAEHQLNLAERRQRG